jgi:hypothetical protein
LIVCDGQCPEDWHDRPADCVSKLVKATGFPAETIIRLRQSIHETRLSIEKWLEEHPEK